MALKGIPFDNLNSKPSLSVLLGLDVYIHPLKDHRIVTYYVLHQLDMLFEVKLVSFEVFDVKHILDLFDHQRVL
jgi:hypothetical protein